MNACLPKKIRRALKSLGITGVISGYFTEIPVATIAERAKGWKRAAYTGWDKDGNVVCVLVKGRSDPEWSLKE